MEAKFEELIDGFITNNIGISEVFLNASLAAALQQNLIRLNKEEGMLKAGIGNTIIEDKNQKIRGDSTCWLEAGSKNDAEMEFMDTIRQFMAHLNRTCYTGLNACEFHYALYEKGTSYGRHKDRLRNDDSRKFSMISYLNSDWTEKDGGQLVIHTGDTSRQILPTNQKAIFFQSDVLEHEVAVANRPRMSITGWLKQV
jgi:SM-20-related protein